MTSRTRAGGLVARILALLLIVAFIVPATAQETITYTYDVLGRLVTVSHGSTGPNAGIASTYTYDAAGNRTQLVVGITITLSPSTLPSGTVNTAYTSTTITATGGTGPYTYAVSSGGLPAGLSLNSGTISGTPSAAGTSNFTITATDSANHTGNQAYSIIVSSANNLTVSPATLPGGTVATAYPSTTFTASGGTSPYTFTKSSGTLPAGLVLSSGVLSGTPTTAAAYSFTIQATDHVGNTGSKLYSVSVSPQNNLTISPSTLPSGTVGTAYQSTTFSATGTGSTSPYTYAVSSGSLPPGLGLSSGVLSGTPTTAATYSFTIRATDHSGNHIGSKAYSVTIGSSNPPITANPDNGGSVSCGGNTVEINVVANDTGGVPPLSLVSATGATVVSSTDVTVTSRATAGTQSFTYVVHDTVGTQATGSGSITVTSPCQ